MQYKTLKLVAISLLVALTAGCATPVQTAGSYKGLTNLDNTKSTLYVYRESSMLGMANQYDVLMNQKLIGSLPNGSFFVVSTDAGSKTVKADTGMGEGSTISVETGKIYCMKLDLNFNVLMKSANINPVSQEQCDKEMKELEEVKF